MRRGGTHVRICHPACFVCLAACCRRLLTTAALQVVRCRGPVPAHHSGQAAAGAPSCGAALARRLGCGAAAPSWAASMPAVAQGTQKTYCILHSCAVAVRAGGGELGPCGRVRPRQCRRMHPTELQPIACAGWPPQEELELEAADGLTVGGLGLGGAREGAGGGAGLSELVSRSVGGCVPVAHASSGGRAGTWRCSRPCLPVWPRCNCCLLPC